MPKVYREVGVSVGMGEYPTNFTSAVIDVMTENDIAKLLVEFPPRYDSYRKIVDIGYITSSQVYRVETYEMSYSDELEKYFFFIGRKFSYGEKVYLQFRCLYEDGQEAVDAAILKLKFRPALRIDDFISYENNDLETQSEILEKLIIQHASVNASTMHTGHVAVDNDTVSIDENGVISAVPGVPRAILTKKEDEFIATIFEDRMWMTNKAILDAEGFIHGVLNTHWLVSQYENGYGYEDLYVNYPHKIYYYTNKTDRTKTTVRIQPMQTAGISEASPDITRLQKTWIGRDASRNQKGVLLKYDLSSLPEDAIVTSAKLGVDIKSIDRDISGLLRPKNVEVHPIGISSVFPSLDQSLQISPETALPETNPIEISTNTEGMIQFDLSSFTVGSAVRDAHLNITFTGGSGIGSEEIGIYRINSFWDEDAVQWDSRPDIEDVPIETFISGSIGSSISIDLSTEVLEIISGSSANYGWYIKYISNTGSETTSILLELNVRHMTNVSWAPLTVTWNNIHDYIEETVPGMVFVATGSYNREIVDVLDEVETWRTYPEFNNGFYIITATEDYIDGVGFNIYDRMNEIPCVYEDLNYIDSTYTYYNLMDMKTDYSGKLPFLLIEYENDIVMGSEIDIWNIFPVYDIKYNKPVSQYSEYYNKPTSVDISVNNQTGIVKIVLIDEDYGGVSENMGTESLSESTTGYLIINIEGEKRTIDIVKPLTTTISTGSACLDPKIVVTDSGSEYVFVKKLNESGTESVIEVYTNIGTSVQSSNNYTTDGTLDKSGYMPNPAWGGGFTSPAVYLISQDVYIVNGYIQFTIPDIPPEAVITNATLSLEVLMYNVWGTSDTNIGIYHLNTDWDETMTWETQPEMGPDNIITTFSVPGMGILEVNLTDEIAALVADPSSNHGWGLKYITDTIPDSVRQIQFADFYSPEYYMTITIDYEISTGITYSWSLEYQSSPVIPTSYTYGVDDTYSYMGGAATSVGDNVYFAYISHSQESGTNPQNGETEDYLQFRVMMLKKIEGTWTEELIYEYPPMFSEEYRYNPEGVYEGYYPPPPGKIYSTYQGAIVSGAIGYPFGLGRMMDDYLQRIVLDQGRLIAPPEPETFLISINAITDSDITIMFPTWKRFEFSGIPDLLLANYNGSAWTIRDVGINNWDPGIRLCGCPTSVQPATILYDAFDRMIISYKVHSSPLMDFLRKIDADFLTFDINGDAPYFNWMSSYPISVPIRYAKLENNRWVSLGELTKSMTTMAYLNNRGTVNILKTLDNSMISVIGKFSDEPNQTGITLFKKTLYYE